MNKEESYIYGLLITDGSLSLYDRNRGRVSLEVNMIDEDIVYKLCNLIPNSHHRERTRNTNFKKDYTTKIFSNTRKEFRDQLISQGFPVKDKTLNASPPILNYSEFDFWRGVIDGDGSIGITSKNIPFISLVTKSENLKIAYTEFIKKFLNHNINVNRNKRDSVYNIMLTKEKAIILANMLYLKENPTIYLDRKYNKALEIQKFTY